MKIGHIDLGERPVFLAPMEDVTDPAFRLMCKKFRSESTRLNSSHHLTSRMPSSA